MDSPNERAFADLERIVDTHGWAIRHVLGDGAAAPFSYTVGLTAKGWDELVITGLPAEVADVFIRNAVDEQESSGAFQPGDRTDALTESGEVALIRVDDRRRLTAAERMLGDFEALQLVWPDSNGSFPRDIGYRNTPEAQPVLGSPRRSFGGGLSADLVHHAMHALSTRMWGITRDVLPTPAVPDDPALRARAMSEFAADYPAIVRMATTAPHAGAGCDDDAEFAFALDLLIDGVARLHEQGWSSPS